MSAAPALTQPGWDVAAIRRDFPILSQPVHGKRLAFLDTAASAQKPRAVIDAMVRCMETGYANIHRGMYALSMQATEDFEAVRRKVTKFLNARSEKEVIFTRGATEGINLIASSFGRKFLKAGDAVLISALEHHANIVPWHLLQQSVGIELRIIPLKADQTLDMDAFHRLLDAKVKLVSVGHVSNALGVINPVQTIIEAAHKQGTPVLIDGCQAAPHLELDMQALGADFYVFSGHKLYGPTGVGVLYGRYEWLEQLPPYHGGGEMIEEVRYEGSRYLPPPHRFEAGTPAIVEVIGLGAALDYWQALDHTALLAYERELLAYGRDALLGIPGLKLFADVPEKIGIFSFAIDGLHPQDLGSILDREGVAIRAGHHCAQPLMGQLGVSATARASLGIYSGRDDIDQLARGLEKAIRLLS